jgi:hypothetical protein
MNRGDLAELAAFVSVADRLSFRSRGVAAQCHAVRAQPFDAAAGGASRGAVTESHHA